MDGEHDGTPAVNDGRIATTTPTGLQAYGDGTVSRIRTKYEARFSARFDERARQRLREGILECANARFDRGKTIDREQALRLRRSFAEIYADAPFLLDARDEEREGTRVKPRSWAFLSARLHAVAVDDGLVRLQAASFRANRRRITAGFDRSTFCWSVHAQTRLHERTPESVRAEREIAKAIVACAGILHVVCTAGRGSEGPDRLSIPCHDGLLLGRIGATAVGTLKNSRIRADGFGLATATIRHGDHADDGSEKTFTGLTYVGADEMRPGQHALRATMLRLRDSYAPLAREIAERFSGGSIATAMRDAKGRLAIRESYDELVERLSPEPAIRSELASFLKAPWVLDEMGNG